jgi:Spy/CpxP family protein refolding chaperone
MRKFIVSGILFSAALAAAPATAQSFGYGYNHRGDSRFDRQIDQLVRQIDRAEDRDMISQREENRLMRQARYLQSLERRYSRGGFNRFEAQDLQHRIQNLRAQFRWERFDDRFDRREYGYRN